MPFFCFLLPRSPNFLSRPLSACPAGTLDERGTPRSTLPLEPQPLFQILQRIFHHRRAHNNSLLGSLCLPACLSGRLAVHLSVRLLACPPACLYSFLYGPLPVALIECPTVCCINRSCRSWIIVNSRVVHCFVEYFCFCLSSDFAIQFKYVI